MNCEVILLTEVTHMFIADCHVHSCFSSDSTEKPENIINTCINKGFKYVYFTDHHDTDFPINPQNPDMDFQLDFDAYFSKLSDLKEQYKDKIEIRIGVEQGICPEVADKVSTLSDSYPFDFIIGSSHLTNLSIENGDPYYPSFYEGRTNVEAYREYFKTEAENVTLTDGFDIYGHIDYPIRYCPDKTFKFNFTDYSDIIEIFFKRLIEKGKGIEINTAGISKIGYAHPHIDILKMYKELGGEIITVGSDAHSTENIGFGFDIAYKLLKELDFKYYSVYKDRKAEFIPL